MNIAMYAITGGQPRPEFVNSMFNLARRPDVGYAHLRPTLYLDHGRTECVVDFLNNDRGTHLLFIDDDTEFTDAAVDELIHAAENGPEGIYGGVYWSPCAGTLDPTNDVFPVVFQWQAGQRESETYRDCWLYKPYPRQWVAEQSTPFHADAVGTGFMLVPKSILVHMAQVYPGPLKWFAMDTIEDVASGEDLVFCHRAKKGLGYPVIAVPCPDGSLNHIKAVRITRPRSLHNA